MRHARIGRIALFDNVKGVAIVLVVVGHVVGYAMDVRTGSHLAQTALTFIYLFHMPVFIFCSGLFAGRSWRKGSSNGADKFLLYLCFYAVFCALVAILDLGILGKSSTVNPFVLDSAPWFLLVLALMMLFVPLLGGARPVPVLVVSVALAVGAGVCMSSPRELSLLCLFTYFPYFAAGFYFTPERAVRCVEAVRARLGAAPTMALAALALAAIFVVLYVLFDDVTLAGIKRMSSGLNLITSVASGAGLPVWFLAVFRVLEYPFVLGMIALLFLAVPTGRCPLSTLGERSLQVYILHVLVVYACNSFGVFELLAAANPYWLATVVALAVALAVVLALPAAPARWVAKLGTWCKRVTSRESKQA